MSPYAPHSTAPESRSLGEEDERRLARQLGVGFDGRHYRYRDYRYDRLADAINYARLEQARSGEKAPAGQPEWAEPLQPTDAERRLMAELGITFDGRAYIYDGYRYDHCQDAANYARLKRARGTGA